MANARVYSRDLQRNMTDYEVSWLLRCLSLTLGNGDVPFDLVGLCLPEVHRLGQLGRDIAISLEANKGIGVEEVGRIMELSESNHPLFLALLPLIRAKVHADATDLFKTYGAWVFEILDWSKCVFHIRTNPFLQATEVGFVVDLKLNEKLQEQAFRRYKYPLRSPLFGGSVLASLFNTSAGLGVHFVDVMFRSMRECIKNMDFDGMIERMNLVPELHSWLVVASQPEMLDDSWIVRLAGRKYYSRNICVEYMQRTLNDQDLLQILKNLTGQIYLEEDLVTVSIPLLFSEFLVKGYTDVIGKVCKTPLLFVSDQDREKDSDFISVFTALCLVLRMLTDVNDDLIDDLSRRLKGIHDQDTLQGLVMDIFSMLFVRNSRTKQFVCSLSGAMKMLSILLMFATEECLVTHLKESLRKVQFVQLVSPRNTATIEKAFVPYNSLLGAALANKDWTVVDRLGDFHPELRKLIKLAKAVNTYTNTNTIDDNLEHAERLALRMELALAFNETSDDLSIDNIKDDSVRELVKRRTEHEFSWTHLTVREWDTLAEMDSKLLRLSASKWTQADYSYFRSNHLTRFFRYLDTLIPLGFECDIGSTVMDVLGFPIRSLVPFLLRKGKVDEAIELSSVTQTDIFLEMLKYSEGHPGTVFPLLQENPIICVAEVLWSRRESVKLPDGLKISSPILQRIISKKDTAAVEQVKARFQRHKSHDSFDEQHPEHMLQRLDIDIEENALKRSLSALIRQKPLPVDEIAEMSFRIDSDWFSELIMAHITSISLSDLCALVEEGVCNGALLEAVDVLREASKVATQVIPYRDGLQQVIKAKKYDLAKRFYNVFGSKISLKEVIDILVSECVELTRASQPVADVLAISPSLKQQVIDALPLKTRSMVLENDPTFFSYVPDGWVVCDTPGDTIIRNICDITNAVMLMDRFPGINIDISLLNLVISNSETPRMEAICKMHRGLHLYFPLVRDKLNFCTTIGNKFLDLVEDITIVDGQGEADVAVQLHRLHLGLLAVHIALTSIRQRSDFSVNLTRITSCIDSIVEFVFRYPSLRYHMSYSLRGFQQREFGLRMTETCYKLDWDGLAMHFIEGWNLKHCELADEYALTCFRLGRYDSTIKFATDRRMNMSDKTTDMVNRFINIVSFSSFYDNSFVAELSEAALPIDVSQYCAEFIVPETKYLYPKSQPKTRSRVSSLPTKRLEWKTVAPEFTPHFYKRISGQVNDMLPWYPNPTRQKGLKMYLKKKAPVIERVRHFVKCGNFETAFDVMRKSPYQSERDELFWSGIFLTGVLSGYVLKLKKKIPRVDPGSFMFGRIIQEKLQEAHDKQLYHLQYLLAFIAGKYSVALDTAILIFNSSDSINSKIQFLDLIRESIDACRAKSDANTNTTKLDEYQRKLPLQKLFCQIVQQRELTYCAGLSLFSTKSVAESMVVYLMKENVFTLALAIVSECSIDIKSIALKASDILINETPDDIARFVTAFEDQADQTQFQRIMNMIMLRVTYTHHNKSVQQFLIKSISDPDFKCRLLIQFDEPDAALSIARRNNLTALLPLIGHSNPTWRSLSVIHSMLK